MQPPVGVISLVYVLHGKLYADDFRLEELEELEDRGEEFERASGRERESSKVSYFCCESAESEKETDTYIHGETYMSEAMRPMAGDRSPT